MQCVRLPILPAMKRRSRPEHSTFRPEGPVGCWTFDRTAPALTANAFFAFLDTCKVAIRRIVRACRGERTEDDMPGEAWIVAEKISAWRQQPVDFKDPADRDLVLAWLYSELVRFPEKTHRYAARIDAGWDGHHDDESSGAALARVLAAPALFDPAVRSQAIEDRAQHLAWADASYSEAAAYAILLGAWAAEVREALTYR